MTDTESRLLRAVLESPGDDTPRLAYADEIDATQPERAEFIRLSLSIEHCTVAKKREQMGRKLSQLFGLHAVSFRQWPEYGRWLDDDYSARLEHGHAVWGPGSKGEVVIHRGFVTEVRAPLAVLVGEECRACGGRGRYYDGAGWTIDACPACSGTGRVPGVGRELFERQPVTRVDTDRLPSTQLINGRIRWAFWREHESGYESLPNITPVSRVPWQLLEYLDAGYESEAAARDALSAALVAHFREQCGLTPLV